MLWDTHEVDIKPFETNFTSNKELKADHFVR
jgi:hypothetical protein